MAKVIVRGGMPGKIRLEVEGSEDGGVEIDSGLTAYQFAHEAQPFMQALLEATAPAKLPSLRPSKAPKADE